MRSMGGLVSLIAASVAAAAVASPPPSATAVVATPSPPASASGSAGVLRDLSFQTQELLDATDHPPQWDNYVPEGTLSAGITLGAPGRMPYPYFQAARFKPAEATGRPRSMAKLSKHSVADRGIRLAGQLDAAEGLDRYYRWYSYFPKRFDVAADPPNAPAVFMAWHGDSSQGSGCNPNVQMHVKRLGPGPRGLHILVRVQGGRHSLKRPTTFKPEGGNPIACYTESFKEIDLGRLVRGRWIDWKVHTRWSSKPAKGSIVINRDGKRTKIPGANLYLTNGASENGYLEQGYYSPIDTSATARRQSIWHMGTVVADSARGIRTPGTGCRRLSPMARTAAAGRGRVGVRVSPRTRRRTATVRLRGGSVRSATAHVGKRTYPFRGGKARIPVRRFGRLGPHKLTVRTATASGGSRAVPVRVFSAFCR